MNRSLSMKVFAFALAVAVVGGGITTLGGYSNAKNAAALAAANGSHDASTSHAPMKIDVVAKRSARTAA